MREEKGEQKSSETLGLLHLFSSIRKLGNSTFQEIFLENIATFIKTSSRNLAGAGTYLRANCAFAPVACGLTFFF